MSKAILSSLQGQYFWWLSIFMDSKLQPVQLYGVSKSRLYEPLGTAIFFRNRFCPVSWILVFLPVHFYGYSLSRSKTAFVINGKIKKFPSLKSPESLDDTALGAVSSKLADHDGMPDRIRTCDLRSRSPTLYPAELRAHIYIYRNIWYTDCCFGHKSSSHDYCGNYYIKTSG